MTKSKLLKKILIFGTLSSLSCIFLTIYGYFLAEDELFYAVYRGYFIYLILFYMFLRYSFVYFQDSFMRGLNLLYFILMIFYLFSLIYVAFLFNLDLFGKPTFFYFTLAPLFLSIISSIVLMILIFKLSVYAKSNFFTIYYVLILGIYIYDLKHKFIPVFPGTILSLILLSGVWSFYQKNVKNIQKDV